MNVRADWRSRVANYNVKRYLKEQWDEVQRTEFIAIRRTTRQRARAISGCNCVLGWNRDGESWL